MAMPTPMVGAPLTATGAVFTAPLETALPTDETTALITGFEALGLVGQDGVTTSEETSREEVRDWSGVIVRSLQTEFGMTVALEFLETKPEVLRAYFGDGRVTEADGLITIVHNADERPASAWVFEMKDGDKRTRLVLPNAQVTETGERVFSKQDVIRYSVTLTAYPDEAGNNGYEYIRHAASAGV